MAGVATPFAAQLLQHLRAVEVGDELRFEQSDPICISLEQLVPELLADRFPKWRGESLDGFYFARALKTGRFSADLVGTCILITDQRMTPFWFQFRVDPEQHSLFVNVKLGEPGEGPVGISGPPWGSHKATKLLFHLLDRLDSVAWVYADESELEI